MIRIAFENEVKTKGSAIQNHGLETGMRSMIVMIVAEIKKNNHHFPVLSVVFIWNFWQI